MKPVHFSFGDVMACGKKRDDVDGWTENLRVVTCWKCQLFLRQG